MQTAEHPFIQASAYIESLRHPAKKRYARDYYQWLREGELEDKRPTWDSTTLGEMAAQAVRLNLRDIMGVDKG